jgi:hypothetical protein
MNTRFMIVGLAIALLFVAANSYAQKMYVPKADEEIYGTWTNQGMEFRKNVSFYGGSRDYMQIEDNVAIFESNVQLVEKWIDTDGNVWYKILGNVISGAYQGTKWQSLEKISKAGTVREWVAKIVTAFADDNYPSAISASDNDYRIYYRSKQ